jgi:hypothetical protein
MRYALRNSVWAFNLAPAFLRGALSLCPPLCMGIAPRQYTEICLLAVLHGAGADEAEQGRERRAGPQRAHRAVLVVRRSAGGRGLHSSIFQRNFERFLRDKGCSGGVQGVYMAGMEAVLRRLGDVLSARNGSG